MTEVMLDPNKPVLDDDEWSGLLKDPYEAFPGCCINVESLRNSMQYIYDHGVTIIVATRFIDLSSRVMELHYLEWSEPFMKMVNFVRWWKHDADVKDYEWEMWGI